MARVTKIKLITVVNWCDALEQFLFFKKAQGISEQTQADYGQQIKLFFKRYPAPFSSADDLKQNLFQHLGQEDIKPCTFNNRLVYLRTFQLVFATGLH